MSLVIALTVGALFGFGTFLVLREDLVKVIWGIALFAQAANVYLVSMGGIEVATAETVPVLDVHNGHIPETGDPLVQALVLTAIVINFGMTSFALALSYRTYQENGTINVTEWVQ
jgi:multicomponent Na+:H+ antiporter subunit C